MAMVPAFKNWRPKFENSAHPIKVVADHKHLKYCMTIKQSFRRQAYWSKFLSRFDFEILYRLGKQGKKSDAQTRRYVNLPADRDDEQIKYQNQVVLRPHNLPSELQKLFQILIMQKATNLNLT